MYTAERLIGERRVRERVSVVTEEQERWEREECNGMVQFISRASRNKLNSQPGISTNRMIFFSSSFAQFSNSSLRVDEHTHYRLFIHVLHQYIQGKDRSAAIITNNEHYSFDALCSCDFRRSPDNGVDCRKTRTRRSVHPHVGYSNKSLSLSLFLSPRPFLTTHPLARFLSSRW